MHVYRIHKTLIQPNTIRHIYANSGIILGKCHAVEDLRAQSIDMGILYVVVVVILIFALLLWLFQFYSSWIHSRYVLISNAAIKFQTPIIFDFLFCFINLFIIFFLVKEGAKSNYFCIIYCLSDCGMNVYTLNGIGLADANFISHIPRNRKPPI